LGKRGSVLLNSQRRKVEALLDSTRRAFWHCEQSPAISKLGFSGVIFA
jgi:hypothetical protein